MPGRVTHPQKPRTGDLAGLWRACVQAPEMLRWGKTLPPAARTEAETTSG